jgi:hypothetical protein
MPTESRQTLREKLGKVDSTSPGLDSKGSSVLAHHFYHPYYTSVQLGRRQRQEHESNHLALTLHVRLVVGLRKGGCLQKREDMTLYCDSADLDSDMSIE